MSTKYKHSHEVPTDVLEKRLEELSDAIGKRGEERDRELTRRVPAELDRDADLVLSEAAARLMALEAHVEALVDWADAYVGSTGLYQEIESARNADTTSLARRDAEQRKVGAASFRLELMESVRMPFRPHIQGVFNVWLRRQAEEANHD